MISQFIRVCRREDIPKGTVRAYHVDNHDIILANDNGRIYALSNTCSHDGGELGEGSLIDGQVVCPRHGARFDIKTGQATRMPAVVGVQKYEVKEEDGDILVALGE